ncbi:MAG: TlpA disulfide reductase family protein [Bacteroidota bacterium]
MKNFQFLFFVIISFSLFNCGGTAQEAPKNTAYTISGTVTEPGENGEVILSIFDPVSQQKTALDTAAINSENNYTLNFEFFEPDLFRVDFPGRQYVMLAIDEGQEKIELNAEGKRNGTVEIKGSPDSEKLLAYDEFRAESNKRLIRPTYDAMRAAGEYNENPAEEIKAVEAYVKASKEHRKELIDFTEKNIATSVALFGTVLRWTGDDEVGRLENLVNNFAAAHPDLKMTKVMADKVARYKKVAIGVKVPDIAENDSSDVIVSLYNAKGKVTLIDFWASWCGPCLRQVPDLLDAYNMYHDKGFEIFGVSVDSKKDKWKASIKKYGMPWPNVSNLKGWGSKAAADYNVTFIPFNVLLDEEGNIIAKNLHSKELQGKLAELLN